MAVRLAWGVVAERDRRAWLLADGQVVDARDRELPDGAAVVLGPPDASDERVGAARAELSALIEAGGVVIAGAGVDVGDGFTSARLPGASGDRRDAVLAALRVLGVEGAERLGDRAATLVALFGVTATKPVGAAAEAAMRENRWAAVHLASAAADLLGPEQLERVLALRAPEGVDPVPSGAPSELAANLRHVLERYSGRRRLDLVLDVWEQVCARGTTLQRQRRLLARQDLTVLEGLRERYRRHDDDLATEHVRAWHGYQQPTVTELARFVPKWPNFWQYAVLKVIEDAVAATVLLRLAMAVEEYGVEGGLARMRTRVAAASSMVKKSAVQAAQRPVDGLLALPARPIVHIRELDMRTRHQHPRDARFEQAVRERLATALPYALVVHEATHTLLCKALPGEFLPPRWDFPSLRGWRSAAGYTAVRPPETWQQQPVVRGHGLGSLAARREEDPAAEEDASDLLWYADLADAIAQVRGLPHAEIRHTWQTIHFDPDQSPPAPDPLTPQPDSIPLAVAGTAQLLSLGAQAPARCRSWAELCAALMTSGAVAEALTSEFQVPETILATDGSRLPDTTARIEIARTARQLAQWSDYMGNCIAAPWYQNAACEGRSVLVALRDVDGTLLVNAELRATTVGWRVNEIRARFNADPDPALAKAFRHYVHSWQWPAPDSADNHEPTEPPAPPVHRGPTRSVLRDIGPRLRELSRESFSHMDSALAALTALAAGGEADSSTNSALRVRDPRVLTALRRATAEELTRLCVEALAARRVTLPELWSATAARPMAAAVEALTPAVRERYPRLRQLVEDAPIASKSLRLLVKDPDLAPSRSMDVVALRLRRTLARLALDGDPALSRALVRDPRTDLLCPLILAVTCASPKYTATVAITRPRETTVPGFPVSSLSDPAGPWQRAWPAAAEIGFEPELFWGQVADTGLLAPAEWLSAGGWPALWRRAAEQPAAGAHPGPATTNTQR
ncbi:hypothetical protein [Nocardia sp. NPDC050406]|uniref:hypothetical protein n=1 Tax=Nocardia sp. NPDC050406 TaxID=3364318 RepID=UPI0037AF47A8